MIVVLAEKPSVARDIAAVLGANLKKAGYFDGNRYQATYAFGQLVTIAESEQMNPAWGQPWKMEQLPMIPTKWVYRLTDRPHSSACHQGQNRAHKRIHEKKTAMAHTMPELC